jgi:hypothetical protein
MMNPVKTVTSELPLSLLVTRVYTAHFVKVEKIRSRAWVVRNCESLQPSRSPIADPYAITYITMICMITFVKRATISNLDSYMPSITYTKNKVAAFWSKIGVAVRETGSYLGNQSRNLWRHAFRPPHMLSASKQHVGYFGNDKISRWARC